jgi:pimeloyl-ACP methyl ester carboxylesterase
MNAAADGADFVRVLLQVLEQQPALRNNPVVIVGESYGGTRASVMLNLLLEPASNWGYVDTSLTAALDAHYAAVFPGMAPQQLTATARALQFGWQVLIQPYLAGSAQTRAQDAIAERTLEGMASDLGVSVQALQSQCGFDVSRTEAWCADVDAAVAENVTSPARFIDLFGVRPELVPGLPASERLGAFRLLPQWDSPPDPAALVEVLGVPSDLDRYFQLSARPSRSGFQPAFSTPFYGALFLRSARHVNTMITNARWDTVVMGESIVPALNELVPLFSPAWFIKAEYAESGTEPPTRARLHFSAIEGIGPAAVRELYMPRYDYSGHLVSVTEPAKLLADVTAFLDDTGLL